MKLIFLILHMIDPCGQSFDLVRAAFDADMMEVCTQLGQDLTGMSSIGLGTVQDFTCVVRTDV